MSPQALMNPVAPPVLKIQLLWWLKTSQASQINQWAHLSGYHRTTESSWLSKSRQGGLDALLEVRPKPGRTTTITGKIRQQLVRVLQDSEGFSSNARKFKGGCKRWVA